MAILKINWIEFRNAAILKLKETYPMINTSANGNYFTIDDRGNQSECYQLPEIIELELTN